jgi:membrane protein DedA with SNARE-associated domain
MRGSDLAVYWIGVLGSLALVLAFVTILISKDAEVIKGALIIAGIAGTAVGGLIGYIGGYHSGQKTGTDKVPEVPEVR